jgi:hypothetical protein
VEQIPPEVFPGQAELLHIVHGSVVLQVHIESLCKLGQFDESAHRPQEQLPGVW